MDKKGDKVLIKFKPGNIHKFYYTNNKGERAQRTGTFVELEYFNKGEIEYYPYDVYCARYFDHEKQADRSFALHRIEIETLTIL
jgi:hypothetical protein